MQDLHGQLGQIDAIGVAIVSCDGHFIVQFVVIDVAVHKQKALVFARSLCQLTLRHGVVLLCNDIFAMGAIIVHNFIEVLDAFRETLGAFHPRKDGALGIVQTHITRSHGKVTVPDFFRPSSQRDAFFVRGNGLFCVSVVTQRVGQVKGVAAIVGGIDESLAQETNVALKLVGFGATVANVHDEGVAFRKHDRTVDARGQLYVLVGDAPVGRSDPAFHDAEISVVELVGALQQTNCLVLANRFCEILFRGTQVGVYPKDHVSVEQEGVLCEWAHLVAFFERDGAIVAKVAKGLLENTPGDLPTFKKGLDEVHGVVRAARVANAVAVDPGRDRFEQTLNDFALILDNHV